MTTDIAERRSSIENEIDGLRRKKGAALLDGKVFSGQSRLTSLRGRLEGLDDGEAERSRRDAIETAKERQKRIDGLRDEGDEVWHAMLGGARDAELAARTFFNAVRDLLSDGKRLCRIIAALGGSVPSQLSKFQLPRILGGLLAAIMTRLPDQSGRLGAILWVGHSPYSADQDWANYLTHRIGPGVMQGLKKGKNDANSNARRDSKTRKRPASG